jgi:DNA-binding GntR family transcriptional regulator
MATSQNEIAQRVVESILAQKLAPGERLGEQELADLFGVSRTLVREALRQLESEGLINVVAHRGPVVSRVTPEQAEGIYQVRIELEGLASQLFAERASEVQRLALKKAFEEVKKSYGSDEAIVRLNAKNRFYECLIEGSGNEALGITLRMLNSRVTLLRATSLQAPGRMRASLAELRELMDALLAGDGKAARDAATRHVQHAAAAAIELLRAEQGQAA